VLISAWTFTTARPGAEKTGRARKPNGSGNGVTHLLPFDDDEREAVPGEF